jgi:hypothetical protein
MRRRSPERVRVWRDVLDAWKRSGQSVNAFCRDRKLTRSNFDRWRRILAAEPTESEPSSSPSFVPLRVVAEPTTIKFNHKSGEASQARVAHVTADYATWWWRDNTPYTGDRKVEGKDQLQSLMERLAAKNKVDLSNRT